jgi:acyl-CoA reductase-like NAD-dependent aldehyde dehydrogenase
MAQTTIKTVSPATNEIIFETPETTLNEARQIVKASWEAFSSFSATKLAERTVIVSRALGLIQERKMELGRELSEQMGRPVAFSHKEIETMQKRADYLISIAEESLDSIPGRAEDGFQRWIEKVPVGPVLVVFAWNVSSYGVFVKMAPLLMSVTSSHI